MKYAITIFSTVLETRSALLSELNDIISILEKNNIDKVEICFGFAWGIEYKDYTPFVVAIDAITEEIKKAEDLGVGSIGNDDFYIEIKELETEILFCHECDMHLNYNNQNPLVSDIIKGWETKNIFHLKRDNSSK